MIIVAAAEEEALRNPLLSITLATFTHSHTHSTHSDTDGRGCRVRCPPAYQERYSTFYPKGPTRFTYTHTLRTLRARGARD